MRAQCKDSPDVPVSPCIFLVKPSTFTAVTIRFVQLQKAYIAISKDKICNCSTPVYKNCHTGDADRKHFHHMPGHTFTSSNGSFTAASSYRKQFYRTKVSMAGTFSLSEPTIAPPPPLLLLACPARAPLWTILALRALLMSPEDAAIVSQWTGARPRPQHGPLAPEATQRTPPATAQRRIAALVCVALVVLLAAVASATTRTAASALYYARSHAAAQGSVALPMGTSPQTTPRTRAEGVHRPPHRIRAAEAGGGPVPPEAPHGPGRPSPATAFGPGPPRATALGLAALVCVLPAAALLRVARARLLRKPGPARVALLTASGAAPPGPEASAPAPAPPQPPLAPEAPCQALQERHPHPRDKTIRFDPADHKYFYQAAPDAWRTASVSVTELVGACFPEFDEEFKIAQMMSRKKWPPVQYTHADGSAFTKEEVACAWHQKRDEAATLGTWMHAEIEKELNGLPPQDAPELRHFRQFEAEVLRPRGIRPFRTEMVVYDEDLDIAGSIDLLAVDDRGVFYICDWKRKADFATKIRTVYRGESGARYAKG